MKTYQNSAKSVYQYLRLNPKSNLHYSLISAFGILLIFLLLSMAASADTFPSFQFQSATSLVVAPNHNLYITGYKNLMGSNTEIVTQQYTPSGKLINEVTNCNPDNDLHNDQPFKILSDKFSNIYVCGHEYVDDTYGYEVVLIKYNANLDLIWKYVIYNSEHFADEARGIALDGDENICITGMQRQYANRSKVFLYKINPNGELLYAVSVPDDYDNKVENVNGLIADSVGNVFICGAVSNKIKAKRFYTACFDASGVLSWKKYNDCTIEKYNDEAKSICFDHWGNIIVSGYGEFNSSNTITLVVKYSPEGIQNWCKILKNHDSGHEVQSAVLADKFGNIFVLVSYNSIKISTEQFTVYKLNNWGMQQWARNINGAFTDAKICSDSLLFITGNLKANMAMLLSLNTSYGIRKSFSSYLPIKSTERQNVSANFLTLGSNQKGDILIACGSSESCGETNFCESNWLVNSFSQKGLCLNNCFDKNTISERDH